MLRINPKDYSTAEFHSYLLGVIAPRPIAFASTIDKDGNVNLSPFSFFNVFGANPPVLIFSPARRVRDNTTKHSLENARATKEVVINIVNYPMVQQMSLASTEYPKGVNEFVKSGFTEQASEVVKPPRVKEAPAAFECVVKEIIETGPDGGAGNLIICEVVMAHISEKILDAKGKIDPHKIDNVGRMGGDWYVRASGNALFEVAKPIRNLGIGVDQIPEEIRLSKILTGNDLGMLANVEHIPDPFTDAEKMQNQQLIKILRLQAADRKNQIHQYAHHLLEENKVEEAWKVLLECK